MKKRGLVFLMCLTVLVGGCSSGITIKHDYDTQANFNSYRTFAWVKQPTAAMGNAQDAVARNSLLDKRVTTAVSDELIKKGLSEDTNNPDLVIAYHTGIESKVDVTDWGYSYPGRYGGWYGGGSNIDVYQYEQGTLIVDLIDARTKQLVWRGSAQGTLETNPTPEKLDKNINNAVAKIFSKYPPN